MRFLRFAVLIASTLTLQACNCGDVNQQNISPTPTPLPAQDGGYWISAGLTQDGEIVVGYYERQDGALWLYHSTGDGTWDREPVHGNPFVQENGLPKDDGDSGRYSSMLIDENDIYIAHYDAKEPGRLRFSNYVSGTAEWFHGEPDPPTSVDNDAGRWNSIARNNAGLIGISYRDDQNQSLKFAVKDGSWTQETVDLGDLTQDAIDAAVDTPDVGTYTSLAWFNGEWWIAYRDEANKDLKVAHGAPGNWVVSMVDGAGTDVGAWPQLFEDNGALLLAYQDVGKQDLLLTYLSGPLMGNTEVVDDSDFVGADSDFVRSGTTLGIVYFDGVNNDVKMATRDDSDPSNWTLQTIGGEGIANGFSVNAFLNGGDLVVVSYNWTDQDVNMFTVPFP